MRFVPIAAHALAVLALSSIACTGVIDDGEPENGGDDPGPGDLVGDPFEEAPAPSLLSDAQLVDVAAQVGGVLSQAAVAQTAQSVMVIDLESGQTVFEKNADDFLIPASNTKLFTSAAAMGALGADHRFVTQGYATTAVEDGVLAGDLYVVGNHDFTASSYFYAKNDLPLARFAKALFDAGLREVQGDLLLAGEMLFEGYNFGSYNATNARATAAVRLESALNAAGIATGVLGTTPSFDPPDGATLIAEHGSAPLSVAFLPLNVVSHNEFADITLRHIGSELGGESSYAAGEREILTYLDSIGLETAGISLKDGSGLSRNNRVSARAVADLLEATINSPEGASFVRTLTVAGVRGTLGNRMGGADTAGRFFGKTGTLNGVIATSGVLFHRHDGRRYLISALMNNVGTNASARGAQDQIVEAIARDLRGAPSPAAPTLLSVQNDASNLTRFEWTESPGADGYVLWLSTDGSTWNRDDARLVRGTSFRADDIDDGLLFARVTAYSNTAGESQPSDTYATTQTRFRSRILLVDGNDRFQGAPAIENPAGLAHQFVRGYAESLADYGFDTVANEAIENGTISLSDYEAVFWMLGEESTGDDALSRSEQSEIAEYLAGGGKLLISGSELGWDLVAEGDPLDGAFFREVLKCDFVADSAGSYAAAPAPSFVGDVAMSRVDFYNPGLLDVAFADVLAPISGGAVLLEYESGGAAAIAYDGDYQSITLGFPLEAIDSAEDRARLLRHAIVTFGL